MSTLPSRATAVAATITSAFVLLLTGCSAGSAVPGTASTAAPPASSAGGPSAEPSATATATAAAAAAGGRLTGESLCALVSAAQAQEALAVSPSVTDQAPGTFAGGEPECGFASADDQTVIVNVIVFDGAKTPFSPNKFELAEGTPRAVAVAGHQAGVSDTELDIADGGEVLTIENFGSAKASSDGLVGLAKLFLDKV